MFKFTDYCKAVSNLVDTKHHCLCHHGHIKCKYTSNHPIVFSGVFPLYLLFSKSLSLSINQTKTQRLLNQGMPNYGKYIKIRHISLADKMYIRTRCSISSFLFIFKKTNPSILPNRMFLSGCQPDVFL